MLYAHNGVAPLIHSTAYVHVSAQVVGDVHLGEESSVWFNTVIRGDGFHIRIGARTNIQDNATLHVATGRWPTIVGDDVTVGHNAVLHGCTVGNRCLVGIGAIVLDGAVIGDDSIVGAGAVVTPGTRIDSGHLAVGNPARLARPLREEERRFLVQSAKNYVANAERYRAQAI